MSLLAPRAEPKSLSSTARTTGKKTARLMAAAGFGFGCLFPLVGTLVEATRNGDSSFEGVLAAQLNTPLLWILDVVPFLLAALCAFIAAPVRSVGNARAGRQLAALLTALVLVPLALLLLALRQDVDSANVLGQINTAGELRARSLWIERAARTNQGDWRQSLRAMGNDIAALRRSYPEEVAEIDSSWRAFHSALTKQNRVSWAQADEMRRATNILTNAIERRAQNRSRAVSTLLLLGMLSLMLGLLKCFDVLRQLRIAENELAESEDRLQRLSEAAFEGIIITENGVILTANARMAAMFGYHVADLIGMPIIKLIAPQSREIVQRAYEEQSETPYSGWGLRRNGTIFEWESEAKAALYHGHPVRVTSVRDMTERRRMEDALRATTQLQTAILDAAAHAIIATDANGLVQTFNPAAEKLLGWRAEEIIGQKTPSLWHDMKEMTAHARELSQELEREFSPLEALMIHPALGEIETHEWTYIRKDGTRIPVALTVTALRDEDETLTGFLGISYDITERRRSENLIAAQRDELAAANERLSRLATTDALTGAFNRRSFSDTLEAEFGRSARSGEAFSLVMLDIDCFKHLNDTFGHPAGDAVLVQLAKILQETCRPADFVARYGGEEFALILPATDAVGARALCERCRIAIESAPWQHRAVTASFGAATIDALSLRNDLSMTLGERVEILIKHADDALYRAKAEGRNRVCHSDDPQNPELSTVENDRTQFSAQTGIPSLSSARETSAPKR